MEIYRIPEDIRFVNQIGQTLSTEEKIKLEIALIKLSEAQSFDQLLFWGRIEGTAANYYIALGLNFKGNFEFPHKTFFYSANLTTFAPLPELNPEYKEQVETFRQLFAGQPEKILINVTGEDGDQPPADQPNPDEPVPVTKNDDDSDVEVKPPPKNFLEIDRLAYVVNAIEFECSLLPIGAVRLTPAHELRYNDSFEGLTLQEASMITNYQHFRAPQTEPKQELIARDDALFYYNFFDPLDDHPVGQWSLQTDSSKYNITIRNLQWPGFVGYHRVGTRVFGYGYFGDGIKNVDLAFQL